MTHHWWFISCDISCVQSKMRRCSGDISIECVHVSELLGTIYHPSIANMLPKFGFQTHAGITERPLKAHCTAQSGPVGDVAWHFERTGRRNSKTECWCFLPLTSQEIYWLIAFHGRLLNEHESVNLLVYYCTNSQYCQFSENFLVPIPIWILHSYCSSGNVRVCIKLQCWLAVSCSYWLRTSIWGGR